LAVLRLEIVPYDDAWPQAFAAERDRIAASLGPIALRIDHHGSTSVRGLAAKPVIDIQVSVAQLHPLEQYAAPLRTLGYEHTPHPDDSVCPFFHKPNVWPHTHHVHVVRAGDAEEARTLAFRDYLRAHPEVAREYENLKRMLVSEHDAGNVASQQAYADAKGPFVIAVTERALAHGYPRALGNPSATAPIAERPDPS
jgi:GrpB-like predicted nucleotidyltransferase (UPF0157 family)